MNSLNIIEEELTEKYLELCRETRFGKGTLGTVHSVPCATLTL